MRLIFRGQIRALHSLWDRYCNAADIDRSREARMAWASQKLGHAVHTFSALTSGEAAQLIDALKRELLGRPVTPPRRPRMDREQAEHFALDGRKGYTPRVEQLAAPEDLAEIERLRERAGMTAEEFQRWLRGRSSPVSGGRILTKAHANRCRWALKAMLRRKELERVS